MTPIDDLLGQLIGQEFVGAKGTELEGKRFRVDFDPLSGRPVVFEIEKRHLDPAALKEAMESGALTGWELIEPDRLTISPLPATRQDTEDQIEFCSAVLVTAGHDDDTIRTAYQARLVALRRHLMRLSLRR